MSVLERIRALAARHPRVVRFVVTTALLAALIPPVARLVPRDTVFVYDLGAAHRAYTRLRLAYVPRGQSEARVLQQRFPGGAPRQHRHRVELSPGRYEIHARLDGPGETADFVREVEVREGGRIDVRLEETNPLHRIDARIER